MFGKNKKENNKGVENKKTDTQAQHVHVMPDIFYGGKDPEYYHSKASGSLAETSLLAEKKPTENKKIEKKPLPEKKIEEEVKNIAEEKQVTKPSPEAVEVITPKGLGRNVQIVIIVLCTLVVIGGVVWFITNSHSGVGTTESVPSSETSVVEEFDQFGEKESEIDDAATAVTVVPVVTSTTSTVAEVDTETEVEVTTTLNFPRMIFVKAPDIDADKLTDVEEELFGTDSGTWDTDGDGYYDGLEVENLYNPDGLAPKRLVESGYVREYVSDLWGYRLYYPTVWQADTVDSENGQTLISTITGDFVDIQVFETEGSTFAEWFAQYAEKQIFSSLEKKVNRFDIEGYVRRDGLVTYVPTKDRVYVMIYNPGPENIIYYPYVMNMIFQGFRVTQAVDSLPEQVILPEPSLPLNADSTTTTQDFVESNTEVSDLGLEGDGILQTEEEVGAEVLDESGVGLGAQNEADQDFGGSEPEGSESESGGESGSDGESDSEATLGAEGDVGTDLISVSEEESLQQGEIAEEEPLVSAQNVITVANFTFSPEVQTVGVGDTVIWRQEDGAPHSLVADNGSFSSPILSTGETFSFTFNTPGTYVYNCGLHPSMIGTIVVE